MAVEEIPLMTAEEQRKSQADQPVKKRALEAWRFTVTSGALAGALILIINITTLAVVCAKYSMVDESITIYTGKCRTTRTVTTIAHVIINILSTILLAYSNFSMQCLNSPTRKEIDATHAKHCWLNIGTPSIRNLFFVSKWKALLWVILAASSFPLHMVWNAVVFETQTTNNYLAVTVTENFLTGGAFDIPEIGRDGYGWFNVDDKDASVVGPTPDYESIIQTLQNQTQNNQLERLSVQECIDGYYKQILTERKHVLLVVDNSYDDFQSAVLAVYDNRYYAMSKGVFTWMCDVDDTTTLNVCLSKDASRNWIPGIAGSDALMLGGQGNAPVRYCYSQTANTDEQCKLHVVPVFLGIVIACNVLKIASALCALYITKKDPPLCTIGDVIQSFLKNPDTHTQNRCLVSKEHFERLRPSTARGWIPRDANGWEIWSGKRYRWFKAINKWQLFVYFVTVTVLVIYAGTSFGIGSRQTSWSAIGNVGFARPDTRFELVWPGTSNVLVAFIRTNIPQVVVSYIYLTLNNMMSGILVMAEWCGYSIASGKPSKGLRVSAPVRDTNQRSNYFLSVPYKWSIPTTIIITTIHWLVSEMIFFTQVDVYLSDPGQILTNNHVFYSPLAMLPAVVLASAVVIGLLALAIFRKYPGSMPLAGGCSASMAAACQPSRVFDNGSAQSTFPQDLANEKLKWGVVHDPDGDSGGIGHATFSADEVTRLVKGGLYV
ncbi:hypothetical protein ASPWEDRAFT_39575 [Aspergillus wentii DTO 134E9]|uniref:DUF6536 domain-containing protein n=1 Tax=Aspergillus wentii DTO 134E9 TaxID=1073089 RepID=A0A1L9RSP7_ASPWE|nr:uncharacterized protein ASPWEDRAFT_39575 [Aspergillus wentii DTO 134E9]KAI9930673.1 hypothetical protein MW887_011428 [Aspergillus wentii]OJJ37837.1 hypothetical protein ASPWEDRAFT_39575 [Aspergillus wentii DTO 134E9]